MNTGRAKKIRREVEDHSEYVIMKKAKRIIWMKANIPKGMPIIIPKKPKSQPSDAFKARRKKINERKRTWRMGIGHKKMRLIKEGLLPRGTLKAKRLRKEDVQPIGSVIGFGYKL